MDPNGLWDQYKPLAGFFQGEDLAPTRPMTANAGADAIALSLQSQNRAVVWVRSQQYDAIGAIRAYEKAFGAGTAGPNWTFQPPTYAGWPWRSMACKMGPIPRAGSARRPASGWRRRRCRRRAARFRCRCRTSAVTWRSNSQRIGNCSGV